MDLNQLITLQRLAREKSFSNTANILGVSQPTVTLRIKNLEEEVGEQLVQRMGQHITLTEAGEEFLKYINRTLRVYNASLKAIDLHKSKPPTLRLASTSSITSHILPQFLGYWYEKHPYTCITLQSGLAQDVLYMVKDGIADVGIIRETSISSSSFQSTFLYEDPVYLVAGSTSRFAEESSQRFSFHQLNEQPLLIYNSSTGRQLAEKVILQYGITPSILARLDSIVTVKRMVMSGLGIALLPWSTISTEVAENSLVPVVEIKSVKLSTLAVTAKSANSSLIPKSPIIELFMSEFKNYCRNVYASALDHPN